MSTGLLPQQTFPPAERRPCFCCYRQAFLIGEEHYYAGVYYHTAETEKDDSGGKVETLVDTWVTSVVEVLCIVRTDAGTEHAYLLEYIPHGEAEIRRAVLAQALLLGRGEEALKELRDLGVSVLGSKTKLVRAYLDGEHLKFSQAKTPNDFWTSVKVIGWAPVGERFVLPHRIIGKQTGIWFSGKSSATQYKSAGTLKEWQHEVAEPCLGNPYLITALSCGLAGPLLELLNIPGLGLHYFGDSTTGKSTALVVAASSWGPEKFVISWRTTINGLEGQAVSRSSTFMPVDESHQVDPKVLDASVYMLLNGTSKARMNKDTSPREIEHWRVCVLSSGERSIETHQASANIDHKIGQAVRIIDLPVVNGAYGLFNHIHQAGSGAHFADSLREAAAQNYGHAGPLFIQKLIDHHDTLKLTELLEAAKEAFGSNLSAQDARVARSFAVIGLAGELAIEWKILPWREGTAITAVVELFAHWQETQPRSTKSKETEQILKAVHDFIDLHGNSRFLSLGWTPQFHYSQDPQVKDQAGYFEDFSGERIYLFTSAGLKAATKGSDFKRVLEALEEAGAFAKNGSKQKAVPTRVPEGQTKNLYHINPTKLQP
jgi:putative DNA primase/helicase